jgi:hypothetical protein
MRSILSLALVALVGTGCHKAAATLAADGGSPLAVKDVTANFASALVQEHEHGTVAVIVGPDGRASALVKNADGTIAKGKITGQMTFGAGEDKKTVPVVVDEATGVIQATGPALTADVTPVSYAFVVDGQPWDGSIEVPPAGTDELVTAAKVQVDPATAKVGPHGGVVQIVGPDRIELVADKDAGQARVFVLDPELKPVELGDRKVTLAFRAGAPDVEIVHLVPEPKGRWLVAPIVLKDDPARITVVVNRGPVAHACIVGYTPTARLVVVGPKAPRTRVFVGGEWAWGPRVKVRGHHGHGHGHWEYDDDEDVVWAPGVVVAPPGVVVHGPGVVVGGPGVVVGGGGGVVVGGGGPRGPVHVAPPAHPGRKH